jgi:hypothetical protein
MMVKRVVFFMLLFAFIAGGVGIGWIGVRGKNALNDIQVKIDKEHAIRDEIQTERRNLEDTVAEEKERLDELPDSMKTMLNAQAVKSSLSFAKAETVIETKEYRVKKRLDFLETEKNLVKGKLYRDTAKLGVVEAVLFIGLIVARRRLNSSRRLSV